MRRCEGGDGSVVASNGALVDWVGGLSSKGGRLSFLMSARGLEGVAERSERFSGVMWMPDGENPLSSEKSLPPPYLRSS